MKLLSRPQANAEAARNRKAQIDEGMKIAGRVDVLRKTLSDLEKQHSEYVSKIKEEGKTIMSGLEQEILALRREIGELTAQKNELLKPLDAEWELARKAKKEGEEVLEEVKGLHIIVEKEKAKQEVNTKKTKESLDKSRVRERALRVAFVEASEDRAMAAKILKDAQLHKEESDKNCLERENELDLRERRNDFDFAANQHQKEINEARSKDLDLREKEIKDKYETLLRTINRTK